MTVSPVPAGYHTVTPYLAIHGLVELLDFVQKGLGATVVERLEPEPGKVVHASVRIGDSMVMMGEAPIGRAPMPAMLYLYVPDADALYAQAIAAGAKSVQEPRDEFYGDRTSAVQDASGNQWWIATHKKDVSTEDMNALAGENMEPRD